MTLDTFSILALDEARDFITGVANSSSKVKRSGVRIRFSRFSPRVRPGRMRSKPKRLKDGRGTVADFTLPAIIGSMSFI